MIRKEKEGIHWLEFELLAEIPGLIHGVFLRHGGYSHGHYESLNLGLHMGDDPSLVNANHKKVRNILGLEHIAHAKQCHGAAVAARKDTSEIPPCDATITDTKNLGLMINHADCQAAIFYDPINKAIGNVHAGWRGNVQNIYAAAVQSMQTIYGTNPKDLLVCISPSLGPERSEFINYRKEFPESFRQFEYKENYFDLWALAEWQLLEAGILPSHIQIARISTYSHPEDFFSYRRSKTTGCHGTVIALAGC